MSRQDSLENLANSLRAIFEKHEILKAIVFGSVARGEPSRRSDLDILVVQQTRKRFLDRYDGIFAEITDVIPGRGVDLLIYTPEELERMSHGPFIGRALKEGVVIYESEP
ncbi:MAG: nucleotidyltransferase family protein [Desulfomonilaceae bacterium]